MGLQDAGTIMVTTAQRGPLVVVRFDWEADGAGNAVLNGITQVQGTLLFADSRHNVSGDTGTLDFELQTELGIDVLEGLTPTIAVNSDVRTPLYTIEVASTKPRPMIAAGRHTFKLARTVAAASAGVFELWVHPLFYWDWIGRG